MDADGARLDVTLWQLLGCFGCGSAALGSLWLVVKKKQDTSTIETAGFAGNVVGSAVLLHPG
jgi:hypothetical protein